MSLFSSRFNSCDNSTRVNKVEKVLIKGRYVLSWGGGLGPQRGGSSVKVSTKRGGPYLM